MLNSNGNANRGMVGKVTSHTLILTAMLLFMLANSAFGASGDFSCYQETANVSTSCGGLANGSYQISGVSVYINYSKPSNVINSSVWQAKHGALATQNFTIPAACWTQSILQFQASSQCNFGRLSSALCYNGSNWIGISTSDSGSAGGCSAGDDSAGTSVIDGDYTTWAASNSNNNAWISTAPDEYPKWYEEAMHWDMNNSSQSITPTPIQNTATKNTLVKWDDTVTITGGSGTCLYNITQLGVQNNTTISITGNSSITNSGNYTNLNFSCNSTSSPYNITFYTEAPGETTSTVSYAGLGGVQTRFYINTTFNNSLNYSLITDAATVQGLRVWKCDALVNATCNASASWTEQAGYTLSGTTVNYTYNMNSNESVVIVSWDLIAGGGGQVGGGGGGGIAALPCNLPNTMVNGSCIAPPLPPGELPSIPGSALFGDAIDKFLRGASFGIPNAWLAILVLLFSIAEGMPRYFAGQSSGLLTVLSLFGIALIGFYYKSSLGLGT